MRFTTPSVLVLASLSLSPVLAQAQAAWEDSDASADTAAAAPATEAAAAPSEEAAEPAPEAVPAAPAPASEKVVLGTAAADADAVIVLKTEEPSRPAEKVSRRVHDRLYLRASLGPGYMKTTFSEGLLASKELSGGAGAFDLQLGGTPAKGLVVGGGLFMSSLEHEDARPVAMALDESNPGSVGVVALGPFIDYYPDPKEGLHFGGMLGLAAIGFDTPGFAGDDAERVATGGAVGAFIGYDWWVAREWSLGAQLRYLGVAAENEEFGWQGAADSLSLQFTVLFN